MTTFTHWSRTSSDPMDPELIRRRQMSVAAARRDPVPDRVEYLRGLVRDKRLLDVGVVDHTLSSDRSEHWLHGQLRDVASTTLGLDIVEAGILELRERGFDVECLDLTLGERPQGRYDVMVAGEIIEHLGSPGALFGAAGDLLDPGGRLVLTTPNPFAVWRSYQHLRGHVEENVDHVTYLDAFGLSELAERAGFRLDEFRGIVPPRQVGSKARLVAWGVRRGVLPLVPEAVAESIIYEFVPIEVPVGG